MEAKLDPVAFGVKILGLVKRESEGRRAGIRARRGRGFIGVNVGRRRAERPIGEGQLPRGGQVAGRIQGVQSILRKKRKRQAGDLLLD